MVLHYSVLQCCNDQYLTLTHYPLTLQEVLLAETVTPLLLWLIVGITFCQAVATDMGKAKKSAM